MNPVADILARFDRLYRERVFRAVVTGTSGEPVIIQRTGQANPDPQAYPRLESYESPAENDEVIVQRVGDGYIVLGKVAR